MRIPTGNLDSFHSGIDSVFDALARSRDTATLLTSEGVDLELLTEAFRQLVEVMTRVEADSRIEDGQVARTLPNSANPPSSCRRTSQAWSSSRDLWISKTG